MITIKRWDNDEVIYTSNKETIKEAVEEAVANKISLAYVDLFGTDLSEADLSEADLSNANLNNINLSKADLYGVKIDEDVDIRKLLNIK